MAYSGGNAGAIYSGEFLEIDFSTYGNAFTNAGSSQESQKMGIRDAGKFEFKWATVDTLGRPLPTRMIEFTASFKCHENRFQDVMNAYYYSNVQLGVTSGIQARIYLSDGKCLSFTAGTPVNGTPTVPTATQTIGCSFEFVDNKTERYIEYQLKVILTKAEYDLMVTNWGTPATGDTGGAVVGIVAGGYSQANVLANGIDHITIAGVNVGIVDDSFTTSIKSRPMSTPEVRGRAVNRNTDVLIKFGLLETDSVALNAMKVSAVTDQAITVVYNSGEIITANAGAVSAIGDFTDSETDQRIVMFSLGGRYPNNPNEASPAFIDFKTSSTGITLSLPGYTHP